MKRLGCAAAAAVLLGCGAPAAPRDPVAKAAAYLGSKQGADGGWHSETYGLLKSGQSLTPFVLLALLELPESSRPPGAVDRAVRFILSHVDAGGALGRLDPTTEDYPNYATALGVRALIRTGRRDDTKRMVDCLLRQQFQEAGGWEKDHPAYGAWGMGGPLRRPPHTGHLDLSMTRHVLEALHDAGLPADHAAFARAQVFLSRLQNPDGGFVFSTVVVDGNKAGRDGDRYRSYGTATADGALSLMAMRIPSGDPRLKSALAWLTRNNRVDAVPGFPGDLPERWSEGMLYYYLAAVSRTTGVDAAAELAKRQRADGSWKNASFLMKEDDPLIATPFALSTLLATGSSGR